MRRLPRVIGILLLITLLIGLAGCAGQAKSSLPSGAEKKTETKAKEVRSLINKQAGLGDGIAVFETVWGKGTPSGNTYSFKKGQFVVEFAAGDDKDRLASKITINHNSPVHSEVLTQFNKSNPSLEGFRGTDSRKITFPAKNPIDLEMFAPGIDAYLPSEYSVNDNTITLTKKLQETNGACTAQCSSTKLTAVSADKNGQFYVNMAYDKSNNILNTVIGKGDLSQ